MMPVDLPPTATIDEQGVVHVDAELSASADELRRILKKPETLQAFKSGIEILSTVPDGPCKRIESKAHTWLGPVQSTFRVCDTPTGWITSLLESEVLEGYRATWSFVPTATGTTLHYTLYVDLKAPLPQFLVEAKAKNMAEKIVGGVVASIEAGRTHEPLLADKGLAAD